MMEDITESEIIKAILKFHPKGSHKQEAIDVAELQLRAIKDQITGIMSRYNSWESHQRKAEFISQQTEDILDEAQIFFNQLDKNLLTTERECKKKMEKIQKQQLRRDIQIKTMLDEQILFIAEQNKVVQLNEEQFKSLFEHFKVIQAKINDQKKLIDNKIFNTRLQLQTIKSEVNKNIKLLKKEHSQRLKELKNKEVSIQSNILQRISSLRQKREKIQAFLIKQIQQTIQINHLL